MGLNGLMDVARPSAIQRNAIGGPTYSKPMDGNRSTAALAQRTLRWPLASGREGTLRRSTQRERHDADCLWQGRLAGHDDSRRQAGNRAQDPNDIAGKILRLKDDGSVPPDNPFVDWPGYRPEIFTLGHRSNVGIEVHPETGAMWTTENGPERRRRDQHPRGRPQLRLARRQLRPHLPGALGHRGAVARVDGTAADFLGAVDCGVRNRVLHRRSVPGVEGQCLRRRHADR